MDEIPDIVKELRDEMTDGWSGDACAVGCDVAERAAVEIERLRAALLAEREAATKAERERWVQAALNASATETLVGNFVTEDDPAIQRGE